MAVLDNGVADHPDLTGNLLRPTGPITDLIDNDNDARPGTDSHGTWIAGIIAARRDGEGMRGVAPEARILSVRIAGDGRIFPIPEMVQGIVLALGQGARVLNLSAGLSGNSDPIDNFMFGPFGIMGQPVMVELPINECCLNAGGVFDPSINALRASDGVVVFAAGNDGWNSESGMVSTVSILGVGSIEVPATDLVARHFSGEPVDRTDVFALLPREDRNLEGHFLAAVALDPFGRIASFSNGCGAAMDWCLAAPGEAIYATCNPADGSCPPDLAPYRSVDGTSLAAPHVAGALAVLFGFAPTMTAAQAVNLVLDTAVPLCLEAGRPQSGAGCTGANSVNSIYGHGRLDLAAALRPRGIMRFASAVDPEGAGAFLLRDSHISATPAFGGAFAAGRFSLGVLDDYRRVYTLSFPTRVAEPGTRTTSELPAVDALHVTEGIDAAGGVSFRALADRLLSLRQQWPLGHHHFVFGYDFGRPCASVSSAFSAPACRYQHRYPLSLNEAFSGFVDAALFSGDSFLSASVEQGIVEYHRKISRFDAGLRYAAGREHRHGALRFTYSPREQIGLALEGGFLQEDSSLLGTRLSGGFGLDGGGSTAYTKVAARFAWRQTQAYASYLVARTAAHPRSGSLISSLSELYSHAFHVGVSRRGLLADDSLRFDLIRPLSVHAGALELQFIGGYTQDEQGQAVYRRDRARLDLSGRAQTIFSATYRLALSQALAFSVSAEHILNAPSRGFSAPDSLLSGALRLEL